MRPATQHLVRGWCPGALRPMESGDGLIVRIRPRCGALQISQLQLLAGLSLRFGNGLIDLTRRGNLQLRGLSEDMLPALWQMLAEADLIDGTAEIEAVRNVMINPLAGLDPSETADLRPLGRELEATLLEDTALQRLPGKFGFGIDGGGKLPLAGERADIWLKAVTADRGFAVALGLDRAEGIDWIGATPSDQAVTKAAEIARAFLAQRSETATRLRDIEAAGYSLLRQALSAGLDPVTLPAGAEPKRLLGPIETECGPIALGLASPFGRVHADALEALALACAALRVPEMRLSPWRSFYLPIHGAETADALGDLAREHGFILDASDPLLSIDACPGTQGCRSAQADTRAAAAELAPLLQAAGYRSCHISGCAKGCARSSPADVVLVGERDGFHVVRNATAQGVSKAWLPQGGLRRLPSLIEGL